MSDLHVGDLVQHLQKREWGIGQIIQIQGETIHIFFPSRPGTDAVPIHLDPKSPRLKRARPDDADPWLRNLPPFERRDGRFRLAEGRLTQQQAVEKFRLIFPKGFDDVDYLGDGKHGERAYKLCSGRMFEELLGRGEGRKLLRAGKIEEAVRRLLRVDASNNLLHLNWDKGPLKDGLEDLRAAKEYLSALLDVVEAPVPERGAFEAMVAALECLPTPGSAVCSWPVATVFPFLARPDVHMHVRPSDTQEAARRLGCELNYTPQPNWKTYGAVLDLSRGLLKSLQKHGLKPRDMIDVQSFMWVAAKYDEPRG